MSNFNFNPHLHLLSNPDFIESQPKPHHSLDLPYYGGKVELAGSPTGDFLCIRVLKGLVHVVVHFTVQEIWRFPCEVKKIFYFEEGKHSEVDLDTQVIERFSIVSTLDGSLWRVPIKQRTPYLSKHPSPPPKRKKGDRVEVAPAEFRLIREEEHLLYKETPISNLLSFKRKSHSEWLILSPQGTCFTVDSSRLGLASEEFKVHVNTHPLEQEKVTCSRIVFPKAEGISDVISVRTFAGLFGTERGLNQQPVLLIGTSAGRVYYQGCEVNSSRLLLCTLEESIVGLLVIRSPPGAGVDDCLAVIGKKGTVRILAMESDFSRPLTKTYFVPSPVLATSQLKEAFILMIGQGQLAVADLWRNHDTKASLPTLLNLTYPNLPILTAIAVAGSKEEVHLVAMTPRNRLLCYHWRADNERQAVHSPEQLRIHIKDTLELIAAHSSERGKLERRMEEVCNAIFHNNSLLYELEKRQEMGLKIAPAVIPTYRWGGLCNLPYLRVTLTVNESTQRSGWKLNVKLGLNPRKYASSTSNQLVYEASLNTGTWEKMIPVPMRHEVFPLRVEVGLRSASHTSDPSKHSAVYLLLEVVTFDVLDFAVPYEPCALPHSYSSPLSINFDRPSGLVKYATDLFHSSGEKKYPSGHERGKSHEIRLIFKSSSTDFDLYKSLLPILLGENTERPRLEKMIVNASTAVFHVPFSSSLLTLLLSRGPEANADGDYLNLTLRSNDRAINLEVEEALLSRIRTFALENKPTILKISPTKVQQLNETQYTVETRWQAINTMRNKPHIPSEELDEKIREFERSYFDLFQMLQTFESNVLASVLL